MTCTIRCRTASTPESECECSCKGANHGGTATLNQYGTTVLDERDPFKEIRIEEDGLEVEEKRETVDSVEHIEVGDKIDVILETADKGWQRQKSVTVEQVSTEEICIEKHDGFSTYVDASQIPADQFNGGDDL